MAKHVVAAAADIPPGTRRLAEIDGRRIVIFNLGGKFYALNNRCPHRGGSLFHGKQTAFAYDECPDELARWLVAEGADLSATDSWGNTPLHIVMA